MADKPVTREEKYLAYLTGDYTGELPKPITRKEKYLYELCLKGMGGEVSPEEIKNAVNEYLEKNPVKPGATTEQAQQIEQNKTDVASLKEETGSLKEDLGNVIQKEASKNLYNPAEKMDGYQLRSNGAPTLNSGYNFTGYINIERYKQITVMMSGFSPVGASAQNAFYDTNKSPVIKRNELGNILTGKSITFDVPDTAKYFGIAYIADQLKPNSTIMVCGGNVAIPYEPYGDTIKIMPSDETKEARGDYESLGERLDAISKINNTVLYFGDSLTQGNQDGTKISRKSVLSSLLGNEWNVENYGVGGESSGTISARASGSWFYIDAGVTIPADGTPVDVTNHIHDMYGTQQKLGNGIYSSAYNPWVTVNPCYVNGIECTLQKANISSPVTIKRNVEGDAVIIERPTRIHMNSETFKKRPVLILCLGQNEGFNRDADILIGQIKGIIEFFECEKYIVVGIPHSLYGYTWEAPINEALKKEFGKHYLDVEGYMKTPVKVNESIVSSYALQDASLTPTEDDLSKIATNMYPTSIMYDGIHFNHYGYEVWANLEYNLGKDLGYWN